MKNYNLLILDGGMGRELEQSGAPFRQPEWSALSLMEAPEYVLQAHQAFVAAGSEVITTNTYAVIPYHIGEERFINHGRELINLSAQLAQKAVSGLKHDVLIAGCIPPLFGSYQPEKFKADQANEILYPFIEEQEDIVDFWLVETLSSIEEMNFIFSELLEKTTKPIWLAFTLKDSEPTPVPLLRSRETVEDAIQSSFEHKTHPNAILFNCSQPECINAALKQAKQSIEHFDIKDIQIGAYANSFVKKQHKPANEAITDLREDITPERYLEFAQEWRDSGASIIGGCCGIGPNYIETLCRSLK